MTTDAELFSEATRLAEAGHYHAAYEHIKLLLEQNDAHLDGWLALVELAQTPQERRQAIYKAWALDPSHPDTNFLLDRLKADTLPPLHHAPEIPKQKEQPDDDARYADSINYHSRAFVTVLLYWFTVFPGLFANLYWLFDSFKRERATGMKQEGVGCLWLQLVFFGLPTLLLLILLVVLLGSAVMVAILEAVTGIA